MTRRTVEITAPKHIDVIQSNIISGAEHLTYQYLHDLYAKNEIGIFHAANQPPRFSGEYSYDPAQMIKDLGDDVHPVKHMTYTEREIAVPFLVAQNTPNPHKNYEPMSAEEVRDFRAGIVIHDMGESEHPLIKDAVGYTVGDIPHRKKTTEDAKLEVNIRNYLYYELFSSVPGDVLDGAERVIQDQDGAFNTVERIGYFRTAMRAGEVALRILKEDPDNRGRRLIQLSRLARRVSEYQRNFIEPRTGSFPLAGLVLSVYQGQYDKIHRQLEHLPMGHPDQEA
jgi:hypothetical protein